VRRWLSDLPLRPKLRLIAGGLAAAGVLAVGSLYASMEIRNALREANTRISAEANAAAYAAAVALHAYDDVLLARALGGLQSDPDFRSATIRDPAGRIISAATEDPGTGASASSRLSAFTNLTASTLDVAVPTTESVGTRLHVELNAETEVAAALERCLIFVLACSVIAAAIVAVLLSLLARTLRRPIGNLVEIMRDMRSSGDFSRRLEKHGNDEFGQLQEEVNQLLGEREGSDRNLRAYKKEFDRRVRERTLQLDVAVAEAREAAKRAEDASRAKSDFLARMSHEIRTPLNGVLGMAELLQHSSTLDDRQRRFAVVIHQSGKALLQLINDILDFSKIEAGKLELENGRFCVRDMVEDALEILAERAQTKGLALICDIPFQLDTVVYADCLRLRQIIINLVSNAVKFTERGDITVKVRAGAGIETATFTFEVTDTGIGIRPENCATIFESFVQEDTSTSRRYGGTGLGLAICKQLVELMGGMIGVSSTVGAGSTFRFSVPLAVDRSAPREKLSTALTTTRVLVVEKSPAARGMLLQHLRSWGAIPTEVGSAQEALTRLGSAFAGEFDALIIDGGLPDATPSEVVAAVRRISAFADIPILIMHTGPGEAPPESHTLHGPVAWQNKPIRRAQLKSALEYLLGKIQDAWRPEPQNKPSAPAGDGEQRQSCVRRVLVVEDNPVNQQVALAMLQTLAIAADTASSGKAALEKLATTRYDAVLMDCQMPDLDGYATTQRYREWELLEGRPRTPVVALTANALSGDAEKCLAAGMDHYVSKPFSIEQLLAVLELCAPAAGESAPDEQRTPEILDAKTLERIRTMNAGTRSDLFARLAELYTSSSAAIVEALRIAAREGDTKGMMQAAHALKSSSANVGALSLAATCGELESAARGSKTQLASDLVESLVREHQEVLRALEQKNLAA
jgi:signal transduction histidine kinase/DNA-binding response OmpR family regulator